MGPWIKSFRSINQSGGRESAAVALLEETSNGTSQGATASAAPTGENTGADVASHLCAASFTATARSLGFAATFFLPNPLGFGTVFLRGAAFFFSLALVVWAALRARLVLAPPALVVLALAVVSAHFRFLLSLSAVEEGSMGSRALARRHGGANNVCVFVVGEVLRYHLCTSHGMQQPTTTVH